MKKSVADALFQLASSLRPQMDEPMRNLAQDIMKLHFQCTMDGILPTEELEKKFEEFADWLPTHSPNLFEWLRDPFLKGSFDETIEYLKGRQAAAQEREIGATMTELPPRSRIF